MQTKRALQKHSSQAEIKRIYGEPKGSPSSNKSKKPDLQSLLNQAQQENAQLREAYAEKTDELNQLENQYAQLEEEYQKLATEHTNLQSQSSLLETQLQEAQTTWAREKEEKEKAITALQTELSEQRRMRGEEAKKHQAELAAERAHSKTEMAKLAQERDQFATLAGQARQKAEQLKKEQIAEEARRAKEVKQLETQLTQLKQQKTTLSYEDTINVMQTLSTQILQQATTEAIKASQQYISQVLQIAPPESKEFPLRLIHQALGAEINLLFGQGPPGMAHDASLQFLASGAYRSCAYTLNFDVNADFFANFSAAEIQPQVQQAIAKFVKCPSSNVVIGDFNRSKGYLSFQLQHDSYERYTQLNSPKFIAYMKKETKNATIDLKLKPYLSALMLTADQMDEAGSQDFTAWQMFKDKRGGMPYYFPIGWKGYGLKVSGRFDGGDDTWLGCTKKELPEWAVGFHGLHKPDVTKAIIAEGLKTDGPRQAYANYEDIITKKKCGKGCYLTPHIETASQYCTNLNINVNGKTRKYLIAMQCRVHPKAIRIPQKDSAVPAHAGDPEWVNDYWIANNTNHIRPYRILLKEVP